MNSERIIQGITGIKGLLGWHVHLRALQLCHNYHILKPSRHGRENIISSY
jgi:hypothetical protein